MRIPILLTFLFAAACGGIVDPQPADAALDAAATGDAAPDVTCTTWYDPAGGECVDMCTHQIVSCPADAAPDACGWTCLHVPGGFELVNTCTGGAASCADVEARCGGLCVLDGGTPIPMGQ